MRWYSQSKLFLIGKLKCLRNTRSMDCLIIMVLNPMLAPFNLFFTKLIDDATPVKGANS